MDAITKQTDNEQTALWNGRAGRAWVVQAKAVIQPRKKLEAEPARELMLFKRLGVPPCRRLAEPRMRFADQAA